MLVKPPIELVGAHGGEGERVPGLRKKRLGSNSAASWTEQLSWTPSGPSTPPPTSPRDQSYPRPEEDAISFPLSHIVGPVRDPERWQRGQRHGGERWTATTSPPRRDFSHEPNPSRGPANPRIHLVPASSGGCIQPAEAGGSPHIRKISTNTMAWMVGTFIFES